MIKKIVEIKNVGKFCDCTASGDVELKKLNVIYAENGRGKTTLCDILRSLKTGDGAYIIGRKTLACTEPQSVNIRIDNTNATFNDGNWNNPYQNTEIFDTTFVHENVHAGDCVDHEHKKNLYRVIVGARGVELALKVDELDAKIREANREISSNKSAIQRIIPDGISFDVFIGLEELADVDKAIREKETELSALSKADEILQKDSLQKLSISELPSDFQRIMSKTITEISSDAERTVKEHIEQHTNNASKEWISSGLRYAKDNICPFCAQSTREADILSAYRSYFSEAYAQLKAEVEVLKDSVAVMYSEASLLRISHTVSNNNTLFDYWRQYLKISKPSFDVSSVTQTLTNLLGVSQRYISSKLQAPLQQIKLGGDFWEALKSFEKAKAAVAGYNSSIEEINKQIAIKKNEIQSADLSRVRGEMLTLKARKRRFDQDAKELCEAYSKAIENKGLLEQEKERVKNELDTYTGTIFNTYEARINKLLEHFGAGFRITETKRRYYGGTASSHYQILINNVPVDLGDSSSLISQPSFRNTLSAGDKSTLALAFFLAQLENDSTLAAKVVILDDPFSSLDRSRRTCTKQLICQLARKARQVIVMSHDPQFLKFIWDSTDRGEIKALQLCRLCQNTTITEWDIEHETQEEYHRNHAILSEYCNNGIGDRKKVAMTIRPLLEQYFGFKFPGQFSETDWLGDFIRKIRESRDRTPLSSAKSILDELDAINDYSKRYHHDTNSGADREPIDDIELQAYAQRALDVVGGY